MTPRKPKAGPPADQNPFQAYAAKAVRPERSILFDDEDLREDPWLDALEAFDSGDKAPMIALMLSGYPMPKSIVPYIGDLLDRYDFSVHQARHASRPTR